MSQQRISLSISTLLLAAACVLAAVLLWQLRGLIVVLMVSVVLAASLAPMVGVVSRWGIPRLLAVILVYLLLVVAIVGVGAIFGPTIFDQIEGLIRTLPGYLDKLSAIAQDISQRVGVFDSPEETAVLDSLSQLFDTQAIGGWIVSSSQQLIVRSYGLTRGIIGDIVGGAFGILLSVIISGYILADSPNLSLGITSIFPSPWDDRLLGQIPVVGQRMGGYIQGRVLVSAILGLVISVSLGILGLGEFALGLGAIAGITNLIPFFGPVLGSIPALIVAVAQGGWTFLWVLLLFVIIQNLETYVLDPLLVGSSVRVQPLYQLLAVLGGTQVLGILGALIVPPWVAGASALLETLYLQPKAEQKERARQSAALATATVESDPPLPV
ncbi:putative permease [Rubidibacter lacunae KORDI 51-2]|uniref:Putative permease n=1 Tax=Rubidibacter lacunae KORDI 51-2 TaxID=582515 RepID=U5DPT4_9CHRO|nr:AI-2E family transporter [Rubidibacter lacunae]ERN42599.1 putative permease [Rubidibacter lacunae KORDI 51-2]